MDPISFIQSHADELVKLCQLLVQTPSENPDGDERDIVAVLERAARNYGLTQTEVREFEDNRPNLLVHLDGAAAGPTLLFVSHTDTKRAGDPAEWTFPPFSGDIHNGKLYGRGSADAKACVTAMLAAAWALSECRCPFRGRLSLVFAADEEGASACGVRDLVANGLTADAAVVGEPTGIHRGFDFLHVAGRGMYNFNVRVRGDQAHSGLAHVLKPVNPALKAAELMLKFDREFAPSCEPHSAFPDGPTVNAGVLVRVNGSYGVIPGEAEFGVGIRVVPGMSRQGLRQDTEQFLRDAMANDPKLDATLIEAHEPLAWSEPQEIDLEHRLVDSARRALLDVLGREPVLGGYPATTDARYLCDAGIPTLPALGPGLITNAHRPDEWVAVDEIGAGAKIYALTALTYLQQ